MKKIKLIWSLMLVCFSLFVISCANDEVENQESSVIAFNTKALSADFDKLFVGLYGNNYSVSNDTKEWADQGIKYFTTEVYTEVNGSNKLMGYALSGNGENHFLEHDGDTGILNDYFLAADGSFTQSTYDLTLSPIYKDIGFDPANPDPGTPSEPNETEPVFYGVSYGWSACEHVGGSLTNCVQYATVQSYVLWIPVGKETKVVPITTRSCDCSTAK